MANQAWQVNTPGRIDLVDLDTPVPKPGPKQVLVRVRAVSFNYRDIVVINHDPSYPGTHKQGLIPCSNGAGTIEEVGPNSTIWKKGDRVIIHPNTWLTSSDPRNFTFEETAGAGTADGTLRRYLLWDEARIFRAPDHLSMEEASTLYTAGVTAYRALFHGPMDFQPGMTVFTQGTGNVSCFAIQIAAAAGATVIATSSSDEKLEVARKLGAKYCINYRTKPDWHLEVLKATDNIGVDLVIDVVGAQALEQSLTATRFGGAVALVGILAEDPRAKVDVALQILYRAQTLVGQLGSGNRTMAEEFVAFSEKYDVKPRIAQVFEWDEADKGLLAATKSTTPGHIVVRI